MKKQALKKLLLFWILGGQFLYSSSDLDGQISKTTNEIQIDLKIYRTEVSLSFTGFPALPELNPKDLSPKITLRLEGLVQLFESE